MHRFSSLRSDEGGVTKDRRRFRRTRAVRRGAQGAPACGSHNTVRADGCGTAVDWFRSLGSLFDEDDLLVLPTAQVFPFANDIHWPQTINGKKMDTYHRWMEVVIGATLAGIPVVNLPVGFDRQGRPMGMQVMGKFAEDQRVLEFAMAYERVTDHLDRRPELVDKT